MSTNNVIKSIQDCPQWSVWGWNHVKFKYHFKQLLSDFELEIIILPLATEAVIKNGVPYTKKQHELGENISEPMPWVLQTKDSYSGGCFFPISLFKMEALRWLVKAH